MQTLDIAIDQIRQNFPWLFIGKQIKAVTGLETDMVTKINFVL